MTNIRLFFYYTYFKILEQRVFIGTNFGNLAWIYPLFRVYYLA